MLPIEVFLLIMVHFRGLWGYKVVPLGDLLNEGLQNQLVVLFECEDVLDVPLLAAGEGEVEDEEADKGEILVELKDIEPVDFLLAMGSVIVLDGRFDGSERMAMFDELVEAGIDVEEQLFGQGQLVVLDSAEDMLGEGYKCIVELLLRHIVFTLFLNIYYLSAFWY